MLGLTTYQILLIVAIILIIFIIYKKGGLTGVSLPSMKMPSFLGGEGMCGQYKGCGACTHNGAEMPGNASYCSTPSGAPAPGTYEDKIASRLAENMEAFTSCGPDQEVKSILNIVCDNDPDKVNFAVNEYGAPGLDYTEFAMSQGVDNKVIENHMQYLTDRSALTPGGEYTGRTFSPDSHMSFDPIRWSGLRRVGSYVDECNPTQTTGLTKEDQVRLYKGNRQFCLKT